jgi:anti-sigma factor RsiW
MRCDEAQALLIEAADGGLAGPLQAEVEGHLAGCRTCRAEAAALRELLRTAAAAAVPEPPASYWATAREELARRIGLRQPPVFRLARLLPLRPWGLAGAAAAFVLVLAAAFLGSRGLFPSAPAGPTPEEVALLRNLEMVQDLELLEQVDILQDYELLRTLARRGRAT